MITTNKKLTTILLAILLFITTGCDPYLNLQPENGISPDQVSVDNISLFLNGLYRRAIPNRDIYVIPDMRGGNYTWTALSGSNGNYGKMVTGEGIDDSFSYSSSIWNDSYKIIYEANNIIEAVEKLATENADKLGMLNRIKGEASYFRATSYFELVRTFGGVPIFTSTETENIPRNSTEEVYKQILSDLDFAIANTVDRSKSGHAHISKQATIAMKARVLLQLGKKKEAATLAKEVINTSKTLKLDANYGGIFRDTNSSTEVIFAFANLKTETNLRMSSLFWPYGTTWAGSYFVQPSNDVLENLYEDKDIRKQVNILKITNDDGTYNVIVSKYWDVQPLIISRLSEMYLIAAEGLPSNEGIEYLNSLRTLRGLTALPNSELQTAQQIEDQVLAERRREFFSEGFLYHDLVRTGRATSLDNTASERNILLPIPGSQINLSEGVLKQNEY